MNGPGVDAGLMQIDIHVHILARQAVEEARKLGFPLFEVPYAMPLSLSHWISSANCGEVAMVCCLMGYS